MTPDNGALQRRGRCLCGAVQFVAKGEPRWIAHCHCESCRRTTSAPLTTYAGFAASAVTWSGVPAAIYRSSQGVERGFCARCGSPISFAGDKWPGEIHLFVASFADPATLPPKVHVHVGEQLPWMHLGDGLPRFLVTPREGAPLPPA